MMRHNNNNNGDDDDNLDYNHLKPKMDHKSIWQWHDCRFHDQSKLWDTPCELCMQVLSKKAGIGTEK